MRKITLILLALLLLPAATVVVEHARGPSYTGPGDIVSGATAWYGLRAYNAAYATAGSNAINVRRASDNTTSNIAVLSTGALNVSAYNTFVGTDATASCTVSSTTFTCTGASSTPHVGDVITGTGLTQPCVATAVGTFTGGAGTVTASVPVSAASCGSVGVAETITFQVAGFVTEAYDQSGNSVPVLQATAGTQPQLLPNCGNSIPCIYTVSSGQKLVSSANTSATQPFTQSYVAQYGAWTGAAQSLVVIGSSVVCVDNSASNVLQMYAGAFGGSVTVNNATWNTLQAVFSGASSNLTVNGSGNSQSPSTGNIASGVVTLGGSTICGNAFLGEYEEFGQWGTTGFSSGQRTSMATNQSAWVP